MYRSLFVSLLLAGPGLVPAEPLSFPAALEIAQRTAADLAMADAELAASTAQLQAAGRLPDPKLKVGIENIPIDGPDRWSLTRDAMTMRTLGLMQEVPNGPAARRRARLRVPRSSARWPSSMCGGWKSGVIPRWPGSLATTSSVAAHCSMSSIARIACLPM